MTAIAKAHPPVVLTRVPRFILAFSTAVMAFLPVAASAHPGVTGHVHGLAYGFMHPFSGVDHVLAMVAVGLLAAQLGGRALWLVPLSFVCVMALAGVAAMTGVALPFVEIGIALSLVVLGLAIVFGLNMPALVASLLVGFFAIFHGHAHGAEMPATSSGLSYGLGFIVATLILHATGVGLGAKLRRTGETYGTPILQLGGAAISVAGVALLLPS